jgi:hypothetical protein
MTPAAKFRIDVTIHNLLTNASQPPQPRPCPKALLSRTRCSPNFRNG